MGRFITRHIYHRLSGFRRARRADMLKVYDYYQKGIRFKRESIGWNEEQKRDWILKTLRRNVRHAARETVYYQNLFRRIGFNPEDDFTFDDFAKLPVLERADIEREGENLVSKNIPFNERLKDSTGGSTGIPTEIWLGPEERGWSESGMQFSFEKVGVPMGSKMAYFWGHHLDPQASDSFSDRLRLFLTNERFFDSFRLSPDVFHQYHAKFEKFSPDCIVAYASALGHFAEYLNEHDIRPRNYPKICFVTGAEKLFPTHRQAIEKAFNYKIPVHERYGGRDFGLTAIQKNPYDSLDFEIDWTWALVEPESTDVNSSILVTKLHADAMPMLRYRVGDNGKFSAASRPGHPTFVLHEVTGRVLDRIWLPAGKWIAGEELPHLLKSFAVKEFMFIQAKDYSVELKIVPKKDFNETEEREILRIVASNLENLPVKINLVDSIERTRSNKWRPVMTKVKDEMK